MLLNHKFLCILGIFALWAIWFFGLLFFWSLA